MRNAGNHRLRLTKSLLVSSCVVAFMGPVAVSADDIDIYSPASGSDHKPAIMIMLDTSASMNQKAKAWQPSRLDRIKAPIRNFITSASGVKVGISAFNGRDQGGSVVYPAMDLDEDLCPNLECDSVSINNSIMREEDDGYELVSNNYVSLTSAGATYGQRYSPYGSAGYYVDQNEGQTVLETSSGMTEVEVLPFSITEAGETGKVALRFPNVYMGTNYDVYRAYVRFEWAGQEWLNETQGGEAAKVRIYMDSREDSPAFADAPGQRVSDRPKTKNYVDWDLKRPAKWNATGDHSLSLITPNLAEVLVEARPPNASRAPVTVIMEPAPGATLTPNSTVNLLGDHSRTTEQPKPRLVFAFKKNPYNPPTYVQGRRFDQVKIPRGATITSAHFEVLSMNRFDDTEEADFVIAAESSGDSPPFQAVRRDISKRIKTTAKVKWSPPKWTDRERKQSPDISTIIQEIVDGADWCSGGAISLIVEGTGQRTTWMHRASTHQTDTLHVTYDPSTVDRSNNCATLTGGNIQRYQAASDLIQGGDINSDAEAFFESQRFHRYAVRFENIDLGPNDYIGDARLELSQINDVAHTTSFYFTVDTDTGSVPLETTETLTKRFEGEESLRLIAPSASAGKRLESIDLAELVQQTVNSPDWERGSAITVGLWSNTNRSGNPKFATAQNTDGEGPSLLISRRVTGSAAASVPVKTRRDELTESLHSLEPYGNTPLVDAFYETAQYLNGGAVEHGKKRGEQRWYNKVHRLSHPDTYDGGDVVRPPGCYLTNPGDPSCAKEFVGGTPVYNAPDSSACRANQIILVTDGAPTPSNESSAGAIRSMTGSATCVATNPAEECALELASWLSSGSTDRHAVEVSAIGFDFSSSFLDQVAEAGNGSTYSVASSGQVSDALRSIGDRAVYGGGTVVPPVAPVNQFTRTSHRGDLYFSLFRPTLSDPLWIGNIKKYRLGKLPDDSVGIVDADGKPLIDPETGLIATGTRSGWTALSDGSDIGKGGAAGQLTYERNILTSPKASTDGNHGARKLEPFNSDNRDITASMLGVTEAERKLVIAWARGMDVKDADKDGVRLEARKHLGAAIHSTPAVVNYPTGGEQGSSVVYVGSQEGYLHAIDATTGRELWAYFPQELYKNLGVFYAASPERSHRYGIDGGVRTHFYDENKNGFVDNGERAYATFGMRRGGGHYYTLDITKPNEPYLVWSIDKTKPGFEDLGQTWSTPVLTSIPVQNGDDVKNRRVLVFGNGYNTVNDLPVRSDRAPHNDRGAIYFVDAVTGELIHTMDVNDHPEMVWSIPSEISVVSPSLDGNAKLLTVGDLGGNLWRVDIAFSRDTEGQLQLNEPKLNLVARLADRPLAETDPTSGTDVGGDRRFFHAPDVGMIEDENRKKFLAVSIGSGRRDSPMSLDTQNRLYFVKMEMDASDWKTIDENYFEDATNSAATLSPKSKGWYVDLQAAGEKMLSTPVLLDGRILGTTYVPPEDGGSDCEPDIGSGRLYVMNAFTAVGEVGAFDGTSSKKRYKELESEGIPPSVAVLISEEDSSEMAVVVGLEAVELPTDMKSRWMTYWIEE